MHEGLRDSVVIHLFYMTSTAKLWQDQEISIPPMLHFARTLMGRKNTIFEKDERDKTKTRCPVCAKSNQVLFLCYVSRKFPLFLLSPHHRSASCSLALSHPPTTWWPPQQRHLPVQNERETTTRQTMQKLRKRARFFPIAIKTCCYLHVLFMEIPTASWLTTSLLRHVSSSLRELFNIH